MFLLLFKCLVKDIRFDCLFTFLDESYILPKKYKKIKCSPTLGYVLFFCLVPNLCGEVSYFDVLLFYFVLHGTFYVLFHTGGDYLHSKVQEVIRIHICRTTMYRNVYNVRLYNLHQNEV